VTSPKCTQCGTVGLETGFLRDSGQGSHGYGEWIAGRLETGPLGNAKVMGRPRFTVAAFRCPNCRHLEFYA
jgi:hypothetical protein